eukprot:scaffold4687_cov117-Isochrysis_galbana.AAC.1
MLASAAGRPGCTGRPRPARPAGKRCSARPRPVRGLLCAMLLRGPAGLAQAVAYWAGQATACGRVPDPIAGHGLPGRGGYARPRPASHARPRPASHARPRPASHARPRPARLAQAVAYWARAGRGLRAGARP